MTLPLYSIPVAIFLIYLPRLIVIRSQASQPGGLDNVDPREQQQNLDERGKRANAAHANGFESFPAYAAAVLVAHLMHADPTLSSAAAVAYMVARTLYPFAYVGGWGKGYIRTAIWSVGLLATLALFVLAAIA